MKVTLYDIIAIICLVIGGLLLICAALSALSSQWLFCAILSISGLFVWHLSTTFAKFAIAASGRQK